MNISVKEQIENELTNCFEKNDFELKHASIHYSKLPNIDFQSNAAFPLAKKSKLSPIEIAKIIITDLEKVEFIQVNLSGNGFINIIIDDVKLKKIVESINSYGFKPTKTSVENVIVDFGGPNVAKPMHVGHLRSLIIGDSLQRLFRYCGDNVTSDIHMGDWGTQMGMIFQEIKERYPNLEYFKNSSLDFPKQSPVSLEELNEIYPLANQKCKEDSLKKEGALKITQELQRGDEGLRALWFNIVELSKEELRKDFKTLDVNFDQWNGESSYQDIAIQLIEKIGKDGWFEKDQLMKLIHLDDEQPPFILTKSDGSFLYSTMDLAALHYRVNEKKANKILYVVDKRQEFHFSQLFEAAKKLSIINDTISTEHIKFGTVNGKDGKPFKTREGGAMRLSDLLSLAKSKAKERIQSSSGSKVSNPNELDLVAHQVGISALKFADLKNVRTSDYIFDIDTSISFEGATGPYIQYTAVRIKSILESNYIENLERCIFLESDSDVVRKIYFELSKSYETIDTAYDKREPHHICNACYDLALAFNKFYEQHSISKEENLTLKRSWLKMSKIVLQTLTTYLELLGIEVPNRM